MHKTGSSTLANIFFRYGDVRDLRFVLPGDTTNLGWPSKFRVTHSLRLFGRPDILSSHSRFNKKPMNWLFPPQTSKYVTVLRNPVDNFESVFNFYQLGKVFGITGNPAHSLEKFLENLMPYYVKRSCSWDTCLGRNPMMFDLGLEFKYFENFTAVAEYIQFLDKEFDLVMIMDYFDKSLVMMKRMLCWEMDDILYVKLNERQDKEKATSLSAEVKENIRRWNKVDVFLFNHFNETFWRKVTMEGPGFLEDLSAFRRRKQETKQLCLNGSRLENAFGRKYVKGYTLRNDLDLSSKVFCETLVRKEIDFLAYLRKKREAKLEELQLVNEDNRMTKETDWDMASDMRYVPIKTSNDA